MHSRPCKLEDVKVGVTLGWLGAIPTLGRPKRYLVKSCSDDHIGIGKWKYVTLLRVDKDDTQRGVPFDYTISDALCGTNWCLLVDDHREFTDEEYEELLV